jgi:hypothetical protein
MAGKIKINEIVFLSAFSEAGNNIIYGRRGGIGTN